MTLPTYDIVKKEDNNFMWVEAAYDNPIREEARL
jgi:hypothetical protein